MKEKNKTEVIDSVQPNYTNTAVGNYFDKATNQWVLVTVLYDPVTGVAKVSDTKEVGASKDFATEAFKLAAIEHDLV